MQAVVNADVHPIAEDPAVLSLLKSEDEYARRSGVETLCKRIIEALNTQNAPRGSDVRQLSCFAYDPASRQLEFAISRYNADEFFADTISQFSVPQQNIIFSCVARGLEASWENRSYSLEVLQSPIVQDAVELALKSKSTEGMNILLKIGAERHLPINVYRTTLKVVEQKGLPIFSNFDSTLRTEICSYLSEHAKTLLSRSELSEFRAETDTHELDRKSSSELSLVDGSWEELYSPDHDEVSLKIYRNAVKSGISERIALLRYLDTWARSWCRT